MPADGWVIARAVVHARFSRGRSWLIIRLLSNRLQCAVPAPSPMSLADVSNTFLATDAFNQYDPVANTWTPLASLSQPIRDARAVYATNTNSIYVFGGIDINELVTNVVQKYDLGTGTWSTVTPMPADRFFPATVYYDATGLIYVAGGIDGSFLETDTTWIYDPVADSWDTKIGRASCRERD